MVVDDADNGGQPEPTAGRLGRVEGLKYLRLVTGRNAAAGITNLQGNVPARPELAADGMAVDVADITYRCSNADFTASVSQ